MKQNKTECCGKCSRVGDAQTVALRGKGKFNYCGETDCFCHTPKTELSACCEAERIICHDTIFKSLPCEGHCSKCWEPFIPKPTKLLQPCSNFHSANSWCQGCGFLKQKHTVPKPEKECNSEHPDCSNTGCFCETEKCCKAKYVEIAPDNKSKNQHMDNCGICFSSPSNSEMWEEDVRNLIEKYSNVEDDPKLARNIKDEIISIISKTIAQARKEGYKVGRDITTNEINIHLQKSRAHERALIREKILKDRSIFRGNNKPTFEELEEKINDYFHYLLTYLEK